MSTIVIVNLIFFAITIVWIVMGITLEILKIGIDKTIGNKFYFTGGIILVAITVALSFL